MTYAVRKRYVDYNPVRDAEKPKGQSEHYEDKELNVLTPSDILFLLDSSSDFKHKTLFMAAVTTGLRQGELLGLRRLRGFIMPDLYIFCKDIESLIDEFIF